MTPFTVALIATLSLALSFVAFCWSLVTQSSVAWKLRGFQTSLVLLLNSFFWSCIAELMW